MGCLLFSEQRQRRSGLGAAVAESMGREERGEIVVGMQNKGINLINSYIHPKKKLSHCLVILHLIYLYLSFSFATHVIHRNQKHVPIMIRAELQLYNRRVFWMVAFTYGFITKRFFLAQIITSMFS